MSDSRQAAVRGGQEVARAYFQWRATYKRWRHVAELLFLGAAVLILGLSLSRRVQWPGPGVWGQEFIPVPAASHRSS